MEFYPKDDLDVSFESVDEESEIQKIYSGSNVFITGATGFMGKILLEKLLRTCNVAQVYLLMREKKGKTQAERLQDLLSDVEMEFYPKDDLDVSFESVDEESEIQKIYSGSNVFITGATGFMGKILLEKLLRTCNVAQVYLLMREKKGKTQAERLQDLLSDVVFERMLLDNRNARQTITLMNGDCTLPDLGLSDGDRKTLRDQVHFVFHLAATVNMAEHLKRSFFINVNATRCLLEQAKAMTKLKAFVYVSTAYSQGLRVDVEEKFYPSKFTAEELEHLVLGLDDNQLSAITPLLFDKEMVNTYSLTKSISEYMVSRYHPEVPVAVVRPSIVISTASEPLVGWIDNINGPVGCILGNFVGFLRVWLTDPNAKADLIPVDIAINTMIAVGWHVAAHTEPDNKIVFHSVSSVDKLITWKELTAGTKKYCYEEKIVPIKSVGRFSFVIVKNAAVLTVYTLWFHFIPGLFCDILMFFARMKPQFLYAYRKVIIANRAVAPYSLKEFQFVGNNVDEVWSIMNAKDRQLFNFDFNSFTNAQYFRNLIRGLRVYLLKDPMDTLPQARTRYFKIYYTTHFVRAILFIIGGWLLYSLMSAYF